MCALCVIGEHADHVVAEIDALHKQQTQNIRELQEIIHDKVERSHAVYTDTNAFRTSILTSCKQVCDITYSIYLV